MESERQIPSTVYLRLQMIPGGGIILIVARRVQLVAADGTVGGHRREVGAKGSKTDNNTLADDCGRTTEPVK